MRTIVVGYSGSERADRALARAAEIAEAGSATLVVVSVSRSAPVAVPAPAPVLGPESVLAPGAAGGPIPAGPSIPPAEVERAPEPQELARRELERARMALAGRGVETEYVAEVGAPAERLLEVAEERDADLIVVGSREHGVLERLTGRAVDQAVARRSARDVLLVR
jgi:nucleotide-binding universal stress UspA family protein